MKTQVLYAAYLPENLQEDRSGKILTEGNLANIRTLLSMEVQKRLNLPVDPNNYSLFVQQEAEIKGAMAAFQMLLDMHVDTIESINSESRPQPTGE